MRLSVLACLGLAVGVLAGGAGGCLGGHSAQRYRILIRDMAYGAPPRGVRVGDTIEWVNQDIFRHTATARDGRFDLDLSPGQTGRVKIFQPGAVEVYCRYHPGMKLRLEVAA